jgi:hypothetical protein
VALFFIFTVCRAYSYFYIFFSVIWFFFYYIFDFNIIYYIFDFNIIYCDSNQEIFQTEIHNCNYSERQPANVIYEISRNLCNKLIDKSLILKGDDALRFSININSIISQQHGFLKTGLTNWTLCAMGTETKILDYEIIKIAKYSATITVTEVFNQIPLSTVDPDPTINSALTDSVLKLKTKLTNKNLYTTNLSEIKTIVDQNNPFANKKLWAIIKL